jgi:hypothetical protein
MTTESGNYWDYGYDSDGSARAQGQVTAAQRRVSSGALAPGFNFS